jgi:hypothetical protein
MDPSAEGSRQLREKLVEMAALFEEIIKMLDAGGSDASAAALGEAEAHLRRLRDRLTSWDEGHGSEV